MGRLTITHWIECPRSLPTISSYTSCTSRSKSTTTSTTISITTATTTIICTCEPTSLTGPRSPCETWIPWGNDSSLVPLMILGFLVGLQCDTKDGVHLMPTLFNVRIKTIHVIQQMITHIQDNQLTVVLVTRKCSLMTWGFIDINSWLPWCEMMRSSFSWWAASKVSWSPWRGIASSNLPLEV